jgi:hypothetical protein
VGIHYLRTELTISGDHSPLALHCDDQVKDSLTSTLGFQGSVAISTGFGVVCPGERRICARVPERRRTIHATATDGSAVSFVTDPPDRYFNVGGVVFVLPDWNLAVLNFSTGRQPFRETNCHRRAAGL